MGPWLNDEVGAVEVTGGVIRVIAVTSPSGSVFVGIRKWIEDVGGGLIATKAGCNVPADQALEFAELTKQAALKVAPNEKEESED